MFGDSDDRLDRIESKLNDRTPIWDKVTELFTDDSIEDIEPSPVTGFIAEGAVKTIMLDWDSNSSIYISNYELFASKVKDFAPDPSNLIFRGKTSGYAHKTDTDEVWYYLVRAVNTHGRSGAYSPEVSETTLRVISDGILFGPDIADELNELSKIAELLFEEAKKGIQQPAIDAAEADAKSKAEAAVAAAKRYAELQAHAAQIAAEAHADGNKVTTEEQARIEQ